MGTNTEQSNEKDGVSALLDCRSQHIAQLQPHATYTTVQRKIRHDSAQIFGQLQVALRTKLAYDYRHESD